MTIVNANVEDCIHLYNSLTDVNFEVDDINFLESIKFKMNNGNILLNFLLNLKSKDIPFKILKGYLHDVEEFNEFKRCIILSEIDIRNYGDESISVLEVDENTFEIIIN